MRLPQIKLKLVDHNCCLDEYEAYEATTSTWQAVKHRWYSLILVSERRRAAKQLFRSSAARFTEKERHHLTKNHYIIHPFSDFRLVWQMLMIVVWGSLLALNPYVYSMFITGVGEPISTASYLHHVTAVSVLGLCCLVDMVVNFFTGYQVPETKEVVLEHKLIVCHYLRTFFLVDLLSSFPLDQFVSIVAPDYYWNSPWHGSFNMVLITLGFLRILRVVTFLNHVRDVCKEFGMHMFSYRTLHVVLVFSITVYWTACLQFLVPQMIHKEGLMDLASPGFGRSWVHYFAVHSAPSLDKLRGCLARTLSYVACSGPCLLPSSTIFLEDFLDRPVMVLIGRILNAYALASVLLMFSSYFATETRYCSMMDQLQTFTYHREIPERLRARLTVYFEYLYQKRYFREHNLLSTMPDLLRHEMNMVTCRRMVERVVIFKHQPRHVISDLVAAMTREVFLEHDVIFKHNTPGHCMYFLASGSVSVVGPVLLPGDQCIYKEVCHLVDGDHFGEVALMDGRRLRVATVEVLETTEVYRLDREDFQRCTAASFSFYKSVSGVADARSSLMSTLIQDQRPPATDSEGSLHALY